MKFKQSVGSVKIELTENDLVYADKDGIRYVKDFDGNIFSTHSFDGVKESSLLVSLVNSQINYINRAVEENWKTYQEYLMNL